MEELVRQQSELQTRRTGILNQRATRKTIEDIPEIMESTLVWVEDLVRKWTSLDYDGKRDVLDRLRAQVVVYRRGAEDGLPHYTAEFSLEGVQAPRERIIPGAVPVWEPLSNLSTTSRSTERNALQFEVRWMK